MKERTKGPMASMLMDMDEKARQEFLKSWYNAQWLTDPIRKALERRRTERIEELINPVSTSNLNQIRADIRGIDFFLSLIP